MDADFTLLKNILTLNQWLGVGFGLSAVIAVLAYRYFFRRKTAQIRKLSKTLRRVGTQVAKNVLLPDDVDGFVFIDYIILTARGIFVVYLLDMPGNIFGAMRMDLWTQLIDNKSFHFKNPLYNLGEALRVIRSRLPDVNVDGRVVFSVAAHFPKGTPENVCSLSALADEVRGLSGVPDSGALPVAWERLMAIIEETRKESQSHAHITRFGRL